MAFQRHIVTIDCLFLQVAAPPELSVCEAYQPQMKDIQLNT